MTRAPRRELRLALLGFGHVGRCFAAGLARGYRPALRRHGCRARVTGILTRRHGAAIDGRGLPLARALALVRRGASLGVLNRSAAVRDAADFIRRVPADVLIEVTPLDPRRGEPALTHVRLALRRGLHVVTANKGPIAFALRPLATLARRRHRALLYESAVMDGAPVFNLVARCLPGVRIQGFRGAVNSTTSYVLSRMEGGATREAALREAQAAGIAEADPRHDLEGWDAAVKGCVLANALMGACVRPADVRRKGIGALRAAEVRRAARAGRPYRLILRGSLAAGRVRVRVAPERVPIGDPLAGSGSDSALVLETDQMGELAIIERGGSVRQTAYGLLSDLLALLRGAPFTQGVYEQHSGRARGGKKRMGRESR